ncbi:hypothetical protein JI739_15315 [Ramlibacter sp. AW1]|uniref:Uncharacterized protein n=1 Tax=Ramlibacter aurantiacus TaxID=2801330 RepID=A0A936ZQ85_9BURK|nr:hypothetical protein [Ramlibacter aurantiacus]
MTKVPPSKPNKDAPSPQFDDVLKRMLSSPPKQHKGKKPDEAKKAPHK